MSEPQTYISNGRGIMLAQNSSLISFCPCCCVTAWNGVHESYCPVAQMAAAIDAIAAERDTELATTQQALAHSEAEAAALRDAITRYLGDVTLGSTVLTAVLWDTEAGVTIESELHQLRQNYAALERQLIQRDRQVETLTITIDDLWGRLLAPWPVRLWRWLREAVGR